MQFSNLGRQFEFCDFFFLLFFIKKLKLNIFIDKKESKEILGRWLPKLTPINNVIPDCFSIIQQNASKPIYETLNHPYEV